MKKFLVFSFIAIVFFISFLEAFAQQYTKYVTVNGAGNHSGQNLANAMTLDEARANAVPGDYIFVSPGEYIAGMSATSFNVSGTEAQPIIWEGVNNDWNEEGIPTTANGSTLFTNYLDNNSAYSIGGNYITLRKIVFYQADTAPNGRTLISISGDYSGLDSCTVIHDINNVSSSSNHTTMVTGTHNFLKYSSFVRGSRCGIWVRKNGGTDGDYFTMEYCKLTGMSNHPPIQIMPATNMNDTTTIKRPIVRNCLFIDSNYGDGIYSRYNEQMAFYNNLFIRSSTPFSVDIHTGLHYPTGTPADTNNCKGGIIAYNTIIENSSQNIIFNKGTNQINFLNNIYYNTATNLDFVFRLDDDWNAIYRHNFDYNLYYVSPPESFGSTNTVRGTWGSNTSVWWSNWNNVTGQEQHTIVNQAPTFTNIGSDDYSPLNSSSPQVGKGSPITRANGYWMDITTDFFGNPRDPNNPTIGAIEYNTGVGDIFPPNLLGAIINNATTVTLNFSEPLSSSTAQNINNYSINNGISVSAASVSGSQVVLTTSSHSAGNYLVTVNNVTDLAGNVINSNNNTAGYNYVEPDITAPILQGVAVNNSTNLTLSFSEALTSATAQNINNYSINNGVNVTAASLSGSQVTLTTSAHSSGSYTITVNNVTDMAGNLINPTSNTANYEYSVVDLTAPQVVSAAIIDSVTLRVLFSENLESSGAVNLNNYAINNISIINATLSSNAVTLVTSVHSSGTYTVTVSNVTDLAGNTIDPQNNSAIYEYQTEPISNLLRLPVSNVLESVVPEPQHNGEKTIDGMGVFDGDPESRWSGDTMPEWLVYDLGDVQILNVTRLSFYRWNEGRTYNYTIQVSSDSVIWTTVRTNALSVAQEWSEEVVGPIDARYIKVIFISSNQNSWAGLWESEFWGHLKIPTDLEDEETTPTAFVLEQNYPNPFNPSTMIQVHIPKNTHMRLVVYNMLGEFIAELVNAEFSSGTYDFNFDARDLSSGIYVYRIESPDFTESKKMILMR